MKDAFGVELFHGDKVVVAKTVGRGGIEQTKAEVVDIGPKSVMVVYTETSVFDSSAYSWNKPLVHQWSRVSAPNRIYKVEMSD